MKNKTTAAILAFFLGGLGVHRFYLGQAGLGLIYLIFCWTLIPSLIAFIDFIVFLTMDENIFNEKYNSSIRPNGMTNISAMDELEKYHALKEKGIISEEEFNKQKSRILKH